MNVANERTNATPTVSALLGGIHDAPNTPVFGIASDSRKVADGDLFIAYQGLTSHGLDFLTEVESQGAAAVVWDASTAQKPATTQLPNIGVENLAARVGEIADRFFGQPSQQLNVIGVTGTNGKTTVAWMLAQSLQNLQQRCAYLGTLGFGVDELQFADGMTTPAAIDLHALLADFVADEATAAAVEVSSHALEQGRVDAVRFDAAIFTNLSRDHLDYHGDMQSYFDAKARLFLHHQPKLRIVNIDTDFGQQLADLCATNIVLVSIRENLGSSDRNYVQACDLQPTADGTRVVFDSSWGKGEFFVALPGEYNVANALAVLAYHLGAGLEFAKACDLISLLQAPPGRMQKVPQAAVDGQPTVYVDYAHTPDALRAALQALKPHCSGRLICVFGCGGDRDKGKRSSMGEIASQNADHIVVTNDNPRSENATSIIEQITVGIEDRVNLTIIEDRAAAIAWSIKKAAANDVVLIAGKGHEDYQLLGDERIAFSDLAVAEQVIEKQQDRS